MIKIDIVKHLFNGTVKMTWTLFIIATLIVLGIAGAIRSGYQSIQRSMKDYPAYEVSSTMVDGERQMGIRIQYNETASEFVSRDENPELWAKYSTAQ
jgi:hypothetical protein